MNRLVPQTALVLLTTTLMGGCGRGNRPQSYPVRTNADRVEALRLTFGTASGTVDSGGGTPSGAEPTGWATLRGRFVLDGAAPEPLVLNVNKDTDVCAPGGMRVLSEELLVGSDGGIRNVAIYLNQSLPDEEPWTHPSAGSSNTQEVVFDQKQCVFLSHVLGIQSSQTLKIMNSDPVGHNTKLAPQKNAGFDQTVPAHGATIYKPKAAEPAPFPVACAIHPWMKAWILVRNNGYFAVTNDDGSFEIPNLPAGIDLEFRVWQEKSKFIQQVSVNGQSQSWQKGRFVLNLDPADESKNQLDVVVSASTFQ